MKTGKSAAAILLAVTACVLALQALSAEPHECVRLSLDDPDGAKFTNVCNEMINMMYCVNNPKSPKSCAAERIGVTTLVPLASEIVPAYAASGGGEIYTAICTYPTAPVGWKPGPDSPFTCKKTCVMC